jgi:hypothetical protein
VSATEELSKAKEAVGYVAPMMYPWPANADGTFTLTGVAAPYAMFQRPPADDAAAHRIATFWKAIAARALGDRSLGFSSAASLADATTSMVSLDATNRDRILREAAQAIRAEAATLTGTDAATGQRRSIALAAAATLDSLASPAALQRGTEEDPGILATLQRQIENFAKTMKALATGALVVGGVASAAVVAGLVWWFVSRRKKT